MVTLSGATRVNAIAISTDRSDDARAWVVGDGGKVWTGVAPYTSWSTANVPGAGRLNGVACTTTQQAVVVAGEGGGIWKTTNNGGLWTSCSPVGSSGVNFYSVSQNPNGTSHFMAVGSGNSAYRSSDGALTWAEMSPFDGGSSTVPLDAGGEYSTPHALKMLSPFVAYIGTLNGQVRRTANGGATWQLETSLPVSTSVNSSLYSLAIYRSRDYYATNLWVAGDGAGRVYFLLPEPSAAPSSSPSSSPAASSSSKSFPSIDTSDSSPAASSSTSIELPRAAMACAVGTPNYTHLLFEVYVM